MTEIVGTANGSGAQGSGAPGSGGRGKKGAAGSKRSTGLTIERIHTTPGVHPYDEVTWERRDVVMTNWRDGSINFEQRGVEFPRVLVDQRHQHRHQQVLPRGGQAPRSASPASAS